MDNFKTKFTVFDTPLESKEYKDLKKEWNSINPSESNLPEFKLEIPSVNYYPNPFNGDKLITSSPDDTNIPNNYFEASFYENPTLSYNPSNLNSTLSYTGNNYIINYFMDKGLTEALARGIYGNIMLESAGKINARSRDGYGSYGLALWTGERKTRLFKMYGNNPTKDEQLEFLWWELNNTHKSALTSLKKTTSVYDATLSFMNNFEKPSKRYANFNNRLKYALS